MPGAVVQRMIVYKDEKTGEECPPVTEWLWSLRPPTWQPSSDGALFFNDWNEADDVAIRLRKEKEKGSIFAARRELPAQPVLKLSGEYSAPRREPRDWHAGKPNCGVD